MNKKILNKYRKEKEVVNKCPSQFIISLELSTFIMFEPGLSSFIHNPHVVYNHFV